MFSRDFVPRLLLRLKLRATKWAHFPAHDFLVVKLVSGPGATMASFGRLGPLAFKISFGAMLSGTPAGRLGVFETSEITGNQGVANSFQVIVLGT